MASPATKRQRHGQFLTFSTPAGVAAIAVAVMAVVALVIMLGPGPGRAPIASDEPSPTPTVTPAEATPSASPTVSSATPVPTPTPVATPAPLLQWTGLAWSDPVTPPFTVHVQDLLPWGDGYVAVGSVEIDATRSEAAFMTSTDGMHWTITEQVDPGIDRFPRHLVALGDELLAFSHRATMEGLGIGSPPGTYHGPLIWSSTDGGLTWTRIDSPSWEDAWIDLRVGPLPDGWDETQYEITTGLVDVASGEDGLVAIGNSYGDGELIAVLQHSADGRAWSRTSLADTAPSALLHEVVAFDGGYVLVGSVNAGPHVDAIPAAWYSADGRIWTVASYPETIAGGGDFAAVSVGANGLLGWYGYREIVAGGPPILAAWSSADGRTWESLGEAASTIPTGYRFTAGDGLRIVTLGPVPHPSTGQPWPGMSEGWISTDGETWAELEMPRTVNDLVEGMWVVPDGVIYAGVQSFWFGAATIGD